ncbi:MAG: rRNA small subunit methyltransferase [Acidimicrobiales bacterium]|nr:rRNA small subunit methyltransferase [Acidimicrobiales bacterium]
MHPRDADEPARPEGAGRFASGSPEGADLVPVGLRAVLEESRTLGFLGPGPIDAHVRHALGYTSARPVASRAVDLGSGGGVPGLVLACMAWPDCTWVLIDSMVRRCRFLRGAVEDLGLGDRVRVVEERAELVARDPAHRSQYDLVVARSFGPAAVTAECGAPLLEPGGCLVVSEPPQVAADRWPSDALATLGLGPAEPVDGPVRLVRLPLVTATGDRWPRRVGIPAKRPLF